MFDRLMEYSEWKPPAKKKKPILREDTHKKKCFFLVVGPLRGGKTTKQKNTFFIEGKKFTKKI